MTLIQFRRGTAAQWAAAGAALAAGEFGYETDTRRYKIGPGNWAALDYSDAPTVLAEIAETLVNAYLAALKFGFVDTGDGEGFMTITKPGTPGGVQFSGTLLPPAATWSGVAGAPEITYVSRFVGAHETFEAAIEAAIAEAADKPLSIVDFEGVNYVTTDTVTVSDDAVVLQNGGITPEGEFRALHVSGDDVTVKDLRFSRATTSAYGEATLNRCTVTVAGERFHSLDCHYLAADLACVYLVNGACDGSVIRGGSMTGAAPVQNGCGVYAGPGNTGHKNLTIEGVHVHDCTDGILLFDTGSSRVAGNRVESLRRLGTVTLTGWTNVAGNVYRQRSATGSTPGTDGPATDRADGTSTVLKDNGSIRTKVAGTSPGTNQWSSVDGYVYLNLGGTDPSTRTITSDIVSGYAYMVYTTTEEYAVNCSYNKFVDNHAEDVDGFGIYLQMSNAAGAIGNQATGNTLNNVCLEGVQTSSLPFGGIGVVGGSDTLLNGNIIDGVGSSGKPVPGVQVYAGSTNSAPGGRIVGTTVRNSYGQGFQIQSSNWTVSACHAVDNVSTGFHVYSITPNAIIEGVSFIGCTANGTQLSPAFAIDGSSEVITRISAQIIGCNAVGNDHRGFQINGATETSVTNCSIIGCLARDNGVAHQQIIISGGVESVVVSGCSMISAETGAVGLYLAASVSDVVAFGNFYDISAGTAEEFYMTPTTLARRVPVPAAYTSTGRSGDYAASNDYVYFATGNNNWRRIEMEALEVWTGE